MGSEKLQYFGSFATCLRFVIDVVIAAIIRRTHLLTHRRQIMPGRSRERRPVWRAELETECNPSARKRQLNGTKLGITEEHRSACNVEHEALRPRVGNTRLLQQKPPWKMTFVREKGDGEDPSRLREDVESQMRRRHAIRGTNFKDPGHRGCIAREQNGVSPRGCAQGGKQG